MINNSNISEFEFPNVILFYNVLPAQPGIIAATTEEDPAHLRPPVAERSSTFQDQRKPYLHNYIQTSAIQTSQGKPERCDASKQV